jgi:hypothetical protein
MKARRVLSVSKCGPQYLWFALKVDGLPTLEVSDTSAVWKVNDDLKETVAQIKRERDEEGRLKIKRVTISGPFNQLLLLVAGLGDTIPKTMDALEEEPPGPPPAIH